MTNISTGLEERYLEVKSYLDLIEGIENAVQSGIPKIGEDGPTITVLQQRVLFSGVYVQLYNVIESTVISCLDEVSKTTMSKNGYSPRHLNDDLKREWIRNTARTHVSMGPDKRLSDAVAMFDHLLSSDTVTEFIVERGGGGNWDDSAIEKIVRRIGCELKISRSVKTGIKRKIRDDLGSMELVVNLRNKLAHGSISFAECGQYDSSSELRDLSDRVISYLREVVKSIEKYLAEHLYLKPEARPTAETPATSL